MSVTTPKGFRAAGVAAGLKSTGKPDVALVVNDGPLFTAAAVTTSNRVFAAPVKWTRAAVVDGEARAVLLNSGGANACTGEAGYADSVATAHHVAGLLSSSDGDEARARRQFAGVGEGREVVDGDVGLARPLADLGEPEDAVAGSGATEDERSEQHGAVVPEDVLVCSTGLIGVRLLMDRLLDGASAAVVALSKTGGPAAANAIMTTDTVPKMVALERTSTGGTWKVGGMAKGAGMLAPGLATMLCVLTTDAVIDPNVADSALREATRLTFERVDSDGCMSTNDTVILLASGASGVVPEPAELTEALTAACADLARQLVADAEGASHDIAVTVRGATSDDAAVAVARAVCRSNLFKAAVFGNDPNWGRVLSAVGTVPPSVTPFDADALDVTINGVQVCRAGGVGEPRELVDLASAREVAVVVDLHAGDATATVWTNDLTHDYVHENSAYSS